jgi:acetylornithine/LysW-gamma-L-lysine aminotransferase
MDYQEIFDIESRYNSGGVGRRPVALVRAKGAKLWDSEGKEYIDCAAAQGWANVGHSHAKVTAALHAQADTLVASNRNRWLRKMVKNDHLA